MEEPLRYLFTDEARLHHALHSAEVMLTNHIASASGVRHAGPLEYLHPARTAAELEATKGQDATHVRPQRATEHQVVEVQERIMPARVAPAQPARVETPW